MDHQHPADIETRARLVDDRLERLLGHARIVLELERRNSIAFVDVAHGTDERDDGADFEVTLAQRIGFRLRVERAGLDADGHRASSPRLAADAASRPSFRRRGV